MRYNARLLPKCKVVETAIVCMFEPIYDIDNIAQKSARSGWPIPVPTFPIADKIPSKETFGLVKIRTESLVKAMHANGRTNLKIRSVSEYPYNCVGMVFCSRRASVDIKHIYDILAHDGYNEISREKLIPGDLVLYTYCEKPSHVGMVSCVSPYELLVLSKWGKDGEVEHDYRQVPNELGIPTAYFSTRTEYVTEKLF